LEREYSEWSLSGRISPLISSRPGN
jgi:hypothetical protein